MPKTILELGQSALLHTLQEPPSAANSWPQLVYVRETFSGGKPAPTHAAGFRGQLSGVCGPQAGSG